MPEYKKYESYRDTVIPWLRQIPSQWQLVLLSQVVTQVKNKNTALQENNLLSLSYGRIKRKPIDSSGGLLPESFEGYNIIEENDIVLRLTDLQNDHTSLRVGISPEKGIITSAYTTMRPRNSSCANYLFYLLHTFDIRKGFYGMGSGVRQGLNYDEVKRLQIPWPTVEEQLHISEYLDQEIDKINAIISEAKASIEEYKTWKATIIYEAVTKGLDPNAEMKDSGIFWIGSIPKGWNVMRLKLFISGYKAGPFGSALITDNLEKEGETLVYTPEHIAKKRTDLENNLYLPAKRIEEMCQFFIRPGDIIFPIVGSLGRAMIITPEMPRGIINQRLAKFRLDSKLLNTEYFLWLFSKSSFYSTYIDLNCRGSIIVNLTKQIVGNMPVVLPASLKEQEEICNYLDQKCGKIDSLITEKEELIRDLESFKKTLLFEVVTGKRRVC